METPSPRAAPLEPGTRMTLGWLGAAPSSKRNRRRMRKKMNYAGTAGMELTLSCEKKKKKVDPTICIREAKIEESVGLLTPLFIKFSIFLRSSNSKFS
jgi:hypothetical protein